MAARPGFEPRQTEPESVVLPLHHRATQKNTKQKDMAARPGFEPRQTEPESVVLPLHHRASSHVL